MSLDDIFDTLTDNQKALLMEAFNAEQALKIELDQGAWIGVHLTVTDFTLQEGSFTYGQRTLQPLTS